MQHLERGISTSTLTYLDSPATDLCTCLPLSRLYIASGEDHAENPEQLTEVTPATLEINSSLRALLENYFPRSTPLQTLLERVYYSINLLQSETVIPPLKRETDITLGIGSFPKPGALLEDLLYHTGFIAYRIILRPAVTTQLHGTRSIGLTEVNLYNRNQDEEDDSLAVARSNGIPLTIAGNEYLTREPLNLTKSQLILNTKAYQHWLL